MSGQMLPQYADFHVHTTFCDGKNTAEEMVQGALAKGIRVLGFSGHAPLPFERGWWVGEDAIEAYRAEIFRLKEKYRGEIRIVLGIEQDYFSHLPIDPYEYAIGSVHMLCKDGRYYDVDLSPDALNQVIDSVYGGDYYALAEDYYAMEADVIRKTKADIIGHFDLVTKFCECGVPFDKDHPRYVSAWKNAADVLLKTGRPFEINTGAISRGYRTTPYPHADILHYLAKNGGCAILSSDTHHKDNFAYAFDMAAALAKETGIVLVNKIAGITF